MKEKTVLIRLRDHMEGDDGWGHEQGHRVFERLLSKVNDHPETEVFHVSLDRIRRTDTSFPRESVVALAKWFRSHRGFCLVDVSDEDLLDNWDAAALKREQPLLVVMPHGYRILGPLPSKGAAPMLEHVMKVERTTAGNASSALGVSVQNASNKLKHLWESGYLLRAEKVAESGGIEHEYFLPI